MNDLYLFDFDRYKQAYHHPEKLSIIHSETSTLYHQGAFVSLSKAIVKRLFITIIKPS